MTAWEITSAPTKLNMVHFFFCKPADGFLSTYILISEMLNLHF